MGTKVNGICKIQHCIRGSLKYPTQKLIGGEDQLGHKPLLSLEPNRCRIFSIQNTLVTIALLTFMSRFSSNIRSFRILFIRIFDFVTYFSYNGHQRLGEKLGTSLVMCRSAHIIKYKYKKRKEKREAFHWLCIFVCVKVFAGKIMQETPNEKLIQHTWTLYFTPKPQFIV